jgi:hypothetical protein
MRGFHYLLRETIFPVHALRMEISVASLMILSISLDFVARILVSCSWMQWPRFILCSVMGDLSR